MLLCATPRGSTSLMHHGLTLHSQQNWSVLFHSLEVSAIWTFFSGSKVSLWCTLIIFSPLTRKFRSSANTKKKTHSERI